MTVSPDPASDARTAAPRPEAPTADAALLSGLLARRFSCRAYAPQPIPEARLREVFAAAQHTPSWCNTQPWQVVVASGATRDDLSTALLAAAQSERPPCPDFAFPPGYDGVYRERRKACGLQLYGVLGIGRDDRERARAQSLENFRFFGAPHVAFVTTDASLGVYGLLDCGLYVMSVLLALEAAGIASIAQAALATWPDVVRARLAIPETRRVVCGIAFGRGLPDAPINSYRTARAAADEVVRFA
jgi:nitroreductase